MSADTRSGDRLFDLAEQAPTQSAARPALVLIARLLGAGLIAPKDAAQGLRDLAYDIRVYGRAEGMGGKVEAFTSRGPALLDEGARAIEAS